LGLQESAVKKLGILFKFNKNDKNCYLH
jgi:hypothetical protein